ncbi:MAG: hypothetical protein WCI02_09020 [Planctomycetota bacterium]
MSRNRQKVDFRWHEPEALADFRWHEPEALADFRWHEPEALADFCTSRELA